jgi:hypothetical protein
VKRSARAAFPVAKRKAGIEKEALKPIQGQNLPEKHRKIGKTTSKPKTEPMFKD